MDAYEATRIVFSRIQALDPDNAAKIMGLLLIQDHGDKEMIRLAFGPETLLHSLILNARKDLGRLPPSTPSTPSTNPSPSPFSLSRQNSRGPNSPSSWAPPPLPFSRTNVDGDGEEYLLQEHLSFLNEQAAPAAEDPVYGMGNYGGCEQRSCMSPDGFGWKPCLYFAKGFCKNGSSCRFLCGPADDMSAAGAGAGAAAAVEQQCQELMLMRSNSQRLAASAAAAFPYSPTGSSSGKCLNFMLQQQQHNESQRAAAAAAAAIMLENENRKFMCRTQMDRGDFAGMVNQGSRQIYLTFPADSTFREEDVSDYFSIYGPVQDVRIPYQQKRMFGFVTFVYPETVKLILAKGNPHFVCDARVLVKPYREKGKVPDKKQQQGEWIDFSGCTTPAGLGSRDPYDLQQLASARMLYGSNGQDVLLRRKMEEQRAEAELRQAIKMQGRRFMGLHLLDIKNQNLASSTAPILSPVATPASTTFSASVFFSDGSSSNGSQDEAVAVEDKSLSPAASGTASAAAADKQETAVNSEERASAETAPNEDISFQESAEHNLPDSPFASPTKKTSFGDDLFSLASEESSSLTSNGISNSNGHLIASTLQAPSSPLENMASFKSSCFFQLPRFSSGHGAVGL